MSEALREELEVVSAIYCREGECQIDDAVNSPVLAVKLEGEAKRTPQVSVTLQFSSLYPQQPPTISCQCEDRSLSRKLVTHLSELSLQFQGSPMVCEILSQTQEMLNQQDFVEKVSQVEESGDQLSGTSQETSGGTVAPLEGEGQVTAVLMLDHMRSKVRYTQTIQKWADSLFLRGCLLFVGKLIFIILQGHSSNVKEYIKLQRSSNVDVDSRGRKCKERMMTVLHQEVSRGRGFPEFSVIECSSMQLVEEIFQRTELLPLYQEHLLPVLASSNVSGTK